MIPAFPSYESRTVVIDRVTVHYLCGGSGPPLLLVHGLGSSAGVEFYYNLETLATRHRVYAVDLPGFGKSDKPSIAYTIEFFVQVLGDFMDAQGLDRVALMGVSRSSLPGQPRRGGSEKNPARHPRDLRGERSHSANGGARALQPPGAGFSSRLILAAPAEGDGGSTRGCASPSLRGPSRNAACVARSGR